MKEWIRHFILRRKWIIIWVKGDGTESGGSIQGLSRRHALRLMEMGNSDFDNRRHGHWTAWPMPWSGPSFLEYARKGEW